MHPITYITTEITVLQATGDDALLITLADPDRWELPPFSAGAHIDLLLGNGIRRSYSLCGDPANPYAYQLAVKRETESRGGSRWIHDQFTPGMEVRVSLPRSTLHLQPDRQQHLLIAGGIGITPMLSLIYSLERAGSCYQLHYFYRGCPPLLTELQQVAVHGEIFLYPEGIRAGRKTELQDIIPQPDDQLCLYCCGPQRMMDAFNLITADWQSAQCQQEHFSGLEVNDSMFPSYQLELRQSGREITVRTGQSPLQALLEANVYVDHSCEGGICGACRVTWCEGSPVHRDKVLTEQQRQQELILCVAGCDSNKLVLDL